ncbi:MAG: hypothetical protein PHU46_13730 [Rhodocyclaceae bacterium]|nr:hypothetical protein [Rhodocyclaceae bacterium]
MRKELDDLLCQRYPNIFAERRGSIQETCMAWGFSCGDGWFTLIETLCERLQFWTDRNQAPQVVTRQVKEKFGTLSFYVRGANDVQCGMIWMAEAMSAHICEKCGQPGKVLNHEGWIMTRCPEHTPEGTRTCRP